MTPYILCKFSAACIHQVRHVYEYKITVIWVCLRVLMRKDNSFKRSYRIEYRPNHVRAGSYFPQQWLFLSSDNTLLNSS